MEYIYLNMLFITCIITLVFMSGFVDNMEIGLKKILNKPFFRIPKPFSCHYCSTFWALVIYIAIEHQLSAENVLICLLMAELTNILPAIITFIENLILKLIDLLNRAFKL